MTAIATVESLVANAVAVTNTATQNANTFSQQAITAAQSQHGIGTISPVHIPELVIPEFDPEVDFTGDFLSAYNDAVADWNPDLSSKANDFINKYCPALDACLKTSVDNWVCAVIQGDRSVSTATGMQAAVENAIWQRGREREAQDANRVVDEAVSGFAARGWSLPSGALIDTVYRAQQAASDKISTHSRDVMIKVADVEIENIRFAVGEGTKLRLGLISALINYLGLWFKLREVAIDKAKALLDAKIRLRESIADYWRAIIAAAGLILEAEKINSDLDVRVEEIEAKNFATEIEGIVAAASAAAEAMGRIAGAALSAQNTLAEVSHQTQATEEAP